MARAVQRDEWLRAGQLLSLIDERVRFGGGPPPLQPWEWMPRGLMLPEERARCGKSGGMATVSLDDLAETLKTVPGYVEGPADGD